MGVDAGRRLRPSGSLFQAVGLASARVSGSWAGEATSFGVLSQRSKEAKAEGLVAKRCAPMVFVAVDCQNLENGDWISGYEF